MHLLASLDVELDSPSSLCVTRSRPFGALSPFASSIIVSFSNATIIGEVLRYVGVVLRTLPAETFLPDSLKGDSAGRRITLTFSFCDGYSLHGGDLNGNEGLPFVFDSFEVVGQSQRHTMELPLNSTVVRFW
jgi:hypothetical protein